MAAAYIAAVAVLRQCSLVVAVAGVVRQCCAAVLCGSGGSGGSVAAVLRQVVVRFAQELLYSGRRENVFPRSIIYGLAQNRLYCFNLPSSQSVNYVSVVTRNV